MKGIKIPSPQYVEVEMYNIEWNTDGKSSTRPLPKIISVTVDLNEGNLIAQAISKAIELTGHTIKNIDFSPIDYNNILGPPEEEKRVKNASIKEGT